MSGNKVEASGCYEHTGSEPEGLQSMSCPATGSFWYFDGERLKSLVNERCMDVHTAHGDVYMATCHSSLASMLRQSGSQVETTKSSISRATW